MPSEFNHSVNYRWIDGPSATEAEWDDLERVLAARGWMSLNRMTSRILLAEQDGRIVGFSVVQLIPSLGPLYVRPNARGTGVAESLADQTIEFMVEAQARGWIAICDNPISVQLCEARGMTRLESPVYVAGGVPDADS